jgi:hypothetical protein
VQPFFSLVFQGLSMVLLLCQEPQRIFFNQKALIGPLFLSPEKIQTQGTGRSSSGVGSIKYLARPEIIGFFGRPLKLLKSLNLNPVLSLTKSVIEKSESNISAALFAAEIVVRLT